MKPVIWTDDKGYKHRSLIRDEDPERFASKGIPAGPPDLDHLDWEEIKRELNNYLVDKELFTWDDVMRSQNGITLALGLLRRRLIAYYRELS